MKKISNDGRYRRIPEQARGVGINFLSKGTEVLVVARKYRGSFLISVTSDMRIRFKNWITSDPMDSDQLKEIFSALGMSFEQIESEKGEM